MAVNVAIVGPSCSGKSTLGAELAERDGLQLVELDALNWLPDWTPIGDEGLRERVREATAEGGWVIAGNYSTTWEVSWPRVEVVVWLDYPLPLVLRRMATRTWRRWRTKEHLWGTNYEPAPWRLLWPDRQKSLLWYTVTEFGRKRRNMISTMADPQWAHIRFVRLRSPGELERWKAGLPRDGGETKLKPAG